MIESCKLKSFIEGATPLAGMAAGWLLGKVAIRRYKQEDGIQWITALYGLFAGLIAGQSLSQFATCSPENYYNSRNWELMLMPTECTRVDSISSTLNGNATLKTDIGVAFVETPDIFSLKSENTLDALLEECQKKPCKDGIVFFKDAFWSDFIATYKTPSGEEHTGIFSPLDNGRHVEASAEKIIEFVNSQKPKIDFCGANMRKAANQYGYVAPHEFETVCDKNGTKIQLLSAETRQRFAERLGLNIGYRDDPDSFKFL